MQRELQPQEQLSVLFSILGTLSISALFSRIGEEEGIIFFIALSRPYVISFGWVLVGKAVVELR